MILGFVVMKTDVVSSQYSKWVERNSVIVSNEKLPKLKLGEKQDTRSIYITVEISTAKSLV